jgi:predicted transcriptional regulator
MTLTPQEQEAMAVADGASVAVHELLRPRDLALKTLASLVRRLLEREKAIVSKAEDAYTRLSRIGWDRTEKQAIEGAIEDLLAIRTMSLAALSAINPGEIK